jgi:methylthioribulose-1-phosphate dehydratase
LAHNSQQSVNETAALAELAAETRRLAALGFMACTGGNVSVRLAERTGLVAAISRSGIDKSRITESDFIAVDHDAKPIPPDSRKPSDETLLHMRIYDAFGCGGICHGHPPHAVALSLAGGDSVRFRSIEMQKAFAGVTDPERELLLPIVENSQDMVELSRRVVAARNAEVPAVLVRGHGVYAWGRSSGEAGRHLETCEWLCRIVVLGRAMGK